MNTPNTPEANMTDLTPLAHLPPEQIDRLTKALEAICKDLPEIRQHVEGNRLSIQVVLAEKETRVSIYTSVESDESENDWSQLPKGNFAIPKKNTSPDSE